MGWQIVGYTLLSIGRFSKVHELGLYDDMLSETAPVDATVKAGKFHDDVIKWKHFPRYWPFVRGIHRSPVNSPHKGQ